MSKISLLALAASFVLVPLVSHADQGSLANAGGSTSVSAAVFVTSPVTAPAGTLTLTCPETSTGQCAGGSVDYVSSDGTTVISGGFSSGKYSETCWGGGRDGTIKCAYSFTGYFSGVWTVNGASQAIVGVTSQSFGTGGAGATGTTGFNSAYTPLYFTDGNARILRSDDLTGTNAIAYGTQGTDVGQFYGPSGIALDSAGRIYITDTYNDRIVRIDDMNGTNWTSFGTYGSDVGQFASPQSISIDPTGHIWVLDNGNGRLIRMDDMSGTNWTTVGTAGSGAGQFGALSSAPGFDALGRIYLADAGNRQIVRFDDLNFTNWITLSQSQPVGPYIFLFGGPTGVVTDQAGKIYVTDGTNVIRVDDMTGANWTSISLGTFAPHTLAIDSSGMVVVGNGYNAQIVDSEAEVLTSSISGLVQGVYVSVYGAVPLSLPDPRPSAISLSPPTLTFSQNVGTTSAAQTITVVNFGGSPLNGFGLSASGGFAATSTCPTVLAPGSTCAFSITFTPSTAGSIAGALTISDDSGNLGPTQVVPLNGTGTTPAAAVSPTTLSFSSQAVGNTSTAKTITLQSTGTGPLTVTSIVTSAPFSQTNTCIGALASGASCTVQVTFAPTVLGSASGTVTITDDAGMQTVGLSASGSTPVSLSTASLNFGSLAVGNISAAKAVTVTNRLNVALSIASIAASGPFAVASTTCGTSVAAGGNCTMSVTFTPMTLGSASGVLTLTDSALTTPQTVSLTGTGSLPVTFSTGSLSFSSTALGNTSVARTLTATNRQTVTLNIASITTSAGFSVASSTCGASLASGASCTVGVTFSPTTLGSITGALTFSDDAPNSPQTVGLSGTGVAPVTLSSSSLSFWTVSVGTTSAAKTVTVTNRQNVALSMGSIAASVPFAVASTTCVASLAAGANCSVTVTFSPTTTGSVSGTLTFVDSAVTSPQVVSLSGTGQ